MVTLKRFFYKKRITNILRFQKVVYQRELARRIGLDVGRTAIFVAKRMCEDGEIVMSDIELVDNLEIQFMWRANEEMSVVEPIKFLKKTLLAEHLNHSKVQRTFGPHIATSSLKEIADNGVLPIDPDNITGPTRSWSGQNKQWANREVMVGRGDIDVVALEKNNDCMILGEVKMRSDRLNKNRARNFFRKACDFRDRIYYEKQKYYGLKLFILCPKATRSAIMWSKEKRMEIIECDYAYYPTHKKRRVKKEERLYDISEFYENYRKYMGVKNLRIVQHPNPSELPIPHITKLMTNIKNCDTV